MEIKEAIRIIQEDLEHCEFHLQDENKADEFYEEMKAYCEADKLAIKALKFIDDNFSTEFRLSQWQEEIKKENNNG